jgi:CRP/FNR family transcriptional regulator, cyclic AMP receptor protein
MKLNDEFILTLLQSLDIFKNIESDSLVQLGRRFKERIFNQDEIIIEEGSIGDSMMVIASGEVRVSQTPVPGEEETLMVLKKGDVFGEMAMLEDLPRSATIIAHTHAITLEISRSDFLDYIEKDCKNGVKILLKLSKILSSRLRETDVKLKAFINFSQWK